ncbi:MAG: hypothetical protein ACLUKN_00350 [Bacilli bacterium]
MKLSVLPAIKSSLFCVEFLSGGLFAAFFLVWDFNNEIVAYWVCFLICIVFFANIFLCLVVAQNIVEFRAKEHGCALRIWASAGLHKNIFVFCQKNARKFFDLQWY